MRYDFQNTSKINETAQIVVAIVGAQAHVQILKNVIFYLSKKKSERSIKFASLHDKSTTTYMFVGKGLKYIHSFYITPVKYRSRISCLNNTYHMHIPLYQDDYSIA